MLSRMYCTVYHRDNQQLIADRVEVAASFITRLRGLLGRKHIPAGSGLLLQPCSSIHCFGMQFPIDAIFLDRHHRVITIRENLSPGSWASQDLAYSVLELGAGEAGKHKIAVGEQLRLAFTDMQEEAGISLFT